MFARPVASVFAGTSSLPGLAVHRFSEASSTAGTAYSRRQGQPWYHAKRKQAAGQTIQRRVRLSIFCGADSRSCAQLCAIERSRTRVVRVETLRRGRIRAKNSERRPEAERRMEDELKDPKTPFEYFLPRPLRLTLLGGTAASCFIACLLGVAKIAGAGALADDLHNLGVNVTGLLVSAYLFQLDQASAETRVERRKEIREAQIEFGDREVYVNQDGEWMSKLKEVDDDWILRRLERWGRKDLLPMIGPEKGKILQNLVIQREPQVVVEVGSFLGYSAILIAQVLPTNSSLISIESDLKFVVTTKRFLWQASQGEANKKRDEPLGRKVSVTWGRAQDVLPTMDAEIDFLFLDGRPKEYLEYLKAAEAKLKPGACIVADNAGVFAEGGLKPYLQYVRTSPKYKSAFIESTLEWRTDIVDGLEVSEYLG